jgi:hypothetical protein
LKTLVRGLIGREDLSQGVGTYNRTTSTGGSQVMTQLSLPSKVIHLGGDAAQFGASADMGAQINAAYAALAAVSGTNLRGGGRIELAAGIYNFTTPIVLQSATNQSVNLRGAGKWSTVLNYTPLTGIALLVDNTQGAQAGMKISDLSLWGPGRATSTVGLQLGASNGAAGTRIQDVTVQAFGDGLKVGLNLSFLTIFDGVYCIANGNSVNFPVGVTSTENVRFINCTFSSSASTLNSPVQLQDSQGDILFLGCSFDDAALIVGSSATDGLRKITLIGGHIENPSQSTNIPIQINNQNVLLDGVNFVSDVAVASYITVTGTAYLTVRNCDFYNSGSTITQAINILAGSTSSVVNIENTERLRSITNAFTDSGTTSIIKLDGNLEGYKRAGKVFPLTTNLLVSNTLPTVSAGFNVGSVAGGNGSASFVVQVGTGSAGSTGTISLPTANGFWNCFATNHTRAAQIQQTATSNNSVTLTNFGTTFAATNFTNSDVIIVSCFAR